MSAGSVAAATRLVVPDVVSVPGGRFKMGSASGRPDEGPVHEVDVQPFAFARTPVSNAAYAGFLAWGRVPPPPWWTHPAFAAPDLPVAGVTWFDAVAYAEWLSERTGRCWRLPTEAEWERAARGGLEGAATAWGASLPAAEVPTGPLDGPWPAGRGTPNGFGLFDMGTIVHEWCVDWYCEDAYVRWPHGQAPDLEGGERRSSRGGSWRHHVRWSSPAARSSLPPGFRYADYGFRVLQEIL